MSSFRVAIGSACLPVSSGDPKKLYSEGEFAYIDIASIDQEAKKLRDTKRLAVLDAPSRARQRIRPGDILVSTVRPNLNAVAEIPQDLDDAIASTGFCVLRPDPTKLLSRYLFHWVKTAPFINEMVRQATGASYPAVTDGIVKSALMPLPPLDEQRRVAAILDQAEELRAKRRAAIALLDQLPQAIFREMFGEPEAVKAWKELRISDFCHTGSGGTPSRQAESKYYNGGTIPWVKSGELRESMIYQTEEHITPLALAESSAKMVPAGAILLAMYGATVGRLAILGISAATNQAVCNIVPDPGIADTTYLYHALQRQVPSMISMAAGGAQPNISQSIVKSLSVVLPPLDMQREFAHTIGGLHYTKTIQQAALTELDALFSAVQETSFRGATR